MMDENLSPMQSMSVQEVVEKWFASLPSAFRLMDPDARFDNTHKYVLMQLHQPHAIGYMVKLKPLSNASYRILAKSRPVSRKVSSHLPLITRSS